MGEGREVLGYTLIRRRPGSRCRYWIERGCWTAIPEDACPFVCLRDLLTQAAEEGALRWVAGDSYHIGRVVRIPGEQTVEALTEPEDGCMWGVRYVLPDPVSSLPWLADHIPLNATCWREVPVPMDLGAARDLSERAEARGYDVYIHPLRVTVSEPRTVVEEVECE